MPKLNLDYYTGVDLYSDGDIENEILDIVKNNTDFTQVLANDTRWPVLYHLTPLRRNLLEWYDFDANASLLEIGAGCGALTGLFCEKNREVVAVELSKKRAEIIAATHREKANLEIIVGNLNDIKFDRKFDYITLIGVLEYAGKFTGTGDAYHDFLEQVRSYLKPDGTLIIAIENKFGLKYWAGAKEDHTNNYFDGIENYLIDRGVRTFGKSELKELLNRAGFANAVFHYPMPDYKLPLQVFSDRYLPRIGQIGGNSPNYDNDRHLLFNEKVVYDNLVLNGQFDFFANSFLVFCTDSGAAPATVYSKFNRDRLPTFQIETSIFRDRDGLRTVKKPLAAAAGPHMARIVKNYELLKDAYRDLSPGIAAGAPAGAGVMIDYMDGKSLDTLIMDALLRRDLAGFHALLDSYVAFVRMLAPGAPASYLPDEGSDRIFGDFSRLTGMAHAAIANIDLRPDNIIVGRDGSYGIIDYEWVFAFPMPVNFVIYRSIRDFWNSYREYLDGAVRREEMFVRYGITAGEREVYDRMEISFQAYINGRNEEYKVKRGYRKAVIPFRGNSTYTLKDVIRKPKLLFRKRK